jgi:adenylosuccinate synthase
MSCTIVVGGQYGSEGKGKVVALLSDAILQPWVVRCGGPNSGHSVWRDNQELVLRQLPTACLNPNAVLLLAAGCAIEEDLLLREIRSLGIPRHRVVVDPRAVVILPADHEEEAQDVPTIASTASGTNAAWIRRMRRRVGVKLAGDSDVLKENVRVEPVAPLLHDCLGDGGNVVVEGTQGFGLSILHGVTYPYLTARDTTAAGLCSEVGLSPRHIDSIVMVIRTFPIRVGGNSGPLEHLIDWEEIKRISGAPSVEAEFTSVTHRLRRVAKFDLELVRCACRYNRPTSLAVMGLDRLDHANRSVRRVDDLSGVARDFVAWVERETGSPVEWAGTGFRTSDFVRLKQITTDAVNASHIRCQLTSPA